MTVTPLRHRVRRYEELEGAPGREVFFRPHRYRAADLAPLKGEVAVGHHRCQLLDVSQNGVAVEWPTDVPVAPNDAIARVLVRFDRFVAYDGSARVGSVREAGGTTVVGLSFDGPALPVEEVLELRSVRAFALEPEQATWEVPGAERFKVLVSELRLLLEDWKARLDVLQARLPWHVLHGEAPSPARDELIAYLRSTFVAKAVAVNDEIDAAIRSVPPGHLTALKHFSHRHLHELFIQSPCVHRMLYKPFGYPGDYEVMRYIYERNFEGPTLFGKAVNLFFIATQAGQAVQARKDLIKSRLAETLEARAGRGTPVRVLSVAAGPAQELTELLTQTEALACPLEIVLFDQDKGALAFAWKRLKSVVDARLGTQVSVLYLNESIKRLLRDADLFSGFGKFDAIYSCGLYDYLQSSTAAVLTRNLYAQLASDGWLAIGNMAPESTSRWLMEHHLDWHLIHRTRNELLEIAHRAIPSAKARILEEESGVNPFFELTKE
jgi:extracellular factor (EF) 3-hydroxypalmitic acid methyl ester biosynthesis protein